MYGEVGVQQMSKIARSKYTDVNFVPVQSINNGVIYLDNNEKVSGIKIMPKNIFILDRSSMDNTLIGLKDVYNLIDYEFWIIYMFICHNLSCYTIMCNLQLKEN